MPMSDTPASHWAERIDWTVKDGRANSSDEFNRLCNEVERLIRESAYDLIAGRAGTVAGLIMAQLAHVHGLRPRGR